MEMVSEPIQVRSEILGHEPPQMFAYDITLPMLYRVYVAFFYTGLPRL